MGHAMATNWFSKRFEEAANSSNQEADRFVVCDIDVARAQSFATMFTEAYPGAKVAVAVTPGE